MRYFILFLFLPLFSLAQSGGQFLTGQWVKSKAQMKDGSRIVDYNGCGMDFLKYNFAADGTVNLSSEVFFDGFKIPYKLGHDSLIVGGTIYNLISLTKDTLKVSFFAPGADDGQLPVYYFTRLKEHNAVSQAAYSAALKDSVYQANNELFPQVNGRTTSLMQAIATNYDKGTLKASFIVDKRGKVKNFTIISIDSISKGFAKTIGSAFGDLEWVPAYKNNAPVSSIVQVTVKTDRLPYGSHMTMMNTLRIKYDFIPGAPYAPIDRDEFETSQQYFKDAITYSNSGNYTKALELLNKCIEIDKINLSAYSFRAIINSNLSKPQDACKDWATLAAFGQVEGSKKLAKFCKN
jgi:hypothetical protein